MVVVCNTESHALQQPPQARIPPHGGDCLVAQPYLSVLGVAALPHVLQELEQRPIPFILGTALRRAASPGKGLLGAAGAKMRRVFAAKKTTPPSAGQGHLLAVHSSFKADKGQGSDRTGALLWAQRCNHPSPARE
eukprot:CAMPEP_0206232910 /NCGR_PEP_ID=MMETSP0047_2-20121206/11682_1 /ASSEMBLY_ACC=CAM_ASM_000192 /TAXON_ID=195065 /ORGANISM="Chroomonas mesostigmatica_cf, Strain CCMP1168" /LENGTH=134 /DNA_ID=CAMNT_0053656707 /DNA_START=671 /DNA_END=1072 /DNA_ORIENTATION=-